MLLTLLKCFGSVGSKKTFPLPFLDYYLRKENRGSRGCESEGEQGMSFKDNSRNQTWVAPY